ncbi:hypothetical protein ACTFIT_000566 [Dictyostelium discoideum]
MKIFIKLFSLINLFFINFIYSKEVCSLIEPIIAFGQTGCENPKIEIGNYRDYDDIIFEPNPISKSFELPNNFIVALDFGINYRITFINVLIIFLEAFKLMMDQDLKVPKEHVLKLSLLILVKVEVNILVKVI